ncbi:hypothetical protein [Halorhabdus rudnickae]|uniref:hypothetical protein n=1 Tax=Halorhabdus rudnickae TaxID=1775544 RepID=UPI00108326E3|nr:hypothetical protein [Halorhabdus rudnickae]
MDRDKWMAIGLGAVGILTFGIGYALVLDARVSYLPGVALTLGGGVVMGVAWALRFRGQVGTISRRRVLAIVGTFAGVGVGSVAITPVVGDGDLANLAFLVFFIPAIVYWITNTRAEAGLDRTDHRTQLLAYKAAFWVLVVIVVLTGVLLWARTLGVYTLSAEPILALVTGIGLFGWYGAFHYLQTHN